MRYIIAIVLCVFVFSLSGCAKKSSTTTAQVATEAPQASSTQPAMTTPAPSPTAPFGRINFSPDLDVAFKPECSAAAAGTGPHSGFTLSFGQNAQIRSGSIRVPDYAGADGTYSDSSKLMSPNPTFSISLAQGTLAPAKDSSITVTIRNHGLEGFATLENFRLNGNSVTVGTISWVCT